MRRRGWQMLCLALLPVWTAWAALSACVPRMVLSVPLLFALTGTLPLCRGRKNLWIFLMTALAFPLPNILLLAELSVRCLGGSCLPMCIPGVLAWSGVLLSLEEVAFGAVGRLIWPKQRPFLPR